jgi:hypothetical protein
VSVNERQRLELYERLGETLGKEHAEVLMEYLPPVGWNDVARRHDLDALRFELRAELAELRSGLDGLRGEMHREFRSQQMWLTTTMLACSGAVLALVAFVD